MQNKTFRLFISSPFSDFEKEREVLHKRVFPVVEKYCEKKGLSFQPVDLRWGVNKEAQLDQKTLELCLEEVRACKHFPHPNFLIMAGDRYGYVPLPYMIEEDEYKNIIEVSSSEDKKILREWYELDENQVYICSDNTKAAAHILQPRSGKYKEYSNWEKQEIRLRTILQKAANQIFLKEDRETSKEHKKYFLSATEQEVIEGICDYKDKTKSQEKCDRKVDKEYVFGYTRTIENIGDTEEEQLFLDRIKKKSVKELKDKADGFRADLKELLTDNVLPTTFHSVEEYKANELKEFENYITAKLLASIDKQISDTEDISKQEMSEQTKFLEDKVKGFQGRKKTLEAIENYLKEKDTNQPLVIHGLSGMGKSSLMAKAIKETKVDNKLFRFIGATADSTTIRNLLISITNELQDKQIIDPLQEYEIDSNKFETQIKDMFSSIKKATTIFIDALDQLQHINHLNWLPSNLPSNLKVVLSVLNDEKYNTSTQEGTHYYERLKQIYTNDNSRFLDIAEDSLEGTKESLVEKLLEVEGRELTKSQTNYLFEKWSITNYSPLYLKIAIEEIKHWSSDDWTEGSNPTIKQQRYGKEQKLNDNVEGIISEYLDNLNILYHHEELLIKKVFGYIHASKDGLSEKELLQILSEDLEDDKEFRDVIINEWHKPIKVKNPRRENQEELVLPISIWSRLHTLIKPFIIERNIDNQPLMKFFHREFTYVIKERYSADKIKQHAKLASYFSSLQDKAKLWDKRYHNLHMLDELPYQLFHAKESEKLKDILFDLEFAGSIYDNYKQDGFKDVLGKATDLDNITDNEIYPWESFYREKDHLFREALVEVGNSHIYIFQLAYEDGSDSPVTKNAEYLLDNKKVSFIWPRKKNSARKFNRSGLQNVFDRRNNGTTKSMIELNNGNLISFSFIGGPTIIYNSKGNFVKNLDDYSEHILLMNGNLIFWSDKKDPVIYNNDGEKLKTLKGHLDSIIKIKELRNGDIITCSKDKTLKIWDNEGKEIRTLKGHTDHILGVIELNNNNIVSWAKDKSLIIFNETGEIVSILKEDIKEISLAKGFTNRNFLSIRGDETVSLWSSEGHVVNKIFAGKRGLHSGTNYFLDNGYFVRFYKYIILYNEKLEKIVSFDKHTGPIYGVLSLNNGNFLSYAGDKILRIWNENGDEIAVLKGHTAKIKKAIILSNHNILSWSDNDADKILRLWNKNGAIIAILKGHTECINGALELKNGNILSYSDDNTLRVWNKSGNLLAVLEGHKGSLFNVLELKNNNVISYGSDIVMWNTNTINVEHTLKYSGNTQDFIILRNGNILSYSDDNIMKVLDIKGQVLKVLDGHKDTINGVLELHDNTILSYSKDKTIMLWNNDGSVKSILEGHEKPIDGVLELINGNILSYSYAWNPTVIMIWNTEGKYLMELEGPYEYELKDIFQLDNGYIFSCWEEVYWEFGDNTDGKIVKVWNSEGKEVSIEEIDFSDINCKLKLSSSKLNIKENYIEVDQNNRIYLPNRGVKFFNKNEFISIDLNRELSFYKLINSVKKF